jgi:hypothetical protein
LVDSLKAYLKNIFAAERLPRTVKEREKEINTRCIIHLTTVLKKKADFCLGDFLACSSCCEKAIKTNCEIFTYESSFSPLSVSPSLSH